MKPSGPVHGLEGWRRWVFLPLAWGVRLWTRSLRFDITPEEATLFRKQECPSVMLLWHNRLFVAGELYRRFRSPRALSALISASRDGGWLSALFAVYGIHAIRGSSSRRYLPATRELLARVHAGSDIAITPDGPRGPCYSFQQGAVMLARQTQAPLLLVSCSFPRRWSLRLRSWDRFFVPLPFAKINLQVIQIASLAAPQDSENREAIAEHLARQLQQMSPEYREKTR